MSHSLYSYLKRKTTEELQNILNLCADDMESPINREIVRLTVRNLWERDAFVQLPLELVEKLTYFSGNIDKVGSR